jgi:S-DNA-T family DNA segregation ATPase FtsK/SpoIIIE
MPIDLPFKREATPPGHVLPPLSLLDPREESFPLTQPGLERMARRLEEKFRELGIDGGVVRIVPGPVVTTFEFRPAVDVKAFKFPGLADELSLMLQAESVRIERGRRDSLMAVALPNPMRRSISLRELLEASAAYPADAVLTIPLGTTATGEPFAIDLARVPHLLLAGSNGASASAALTAMLASLVCRVTPEKVRFILVDSNPLGLGMLEGIPHLLTPVVRDAWRGAYVLRWAVSRMEERNRNVRRGAGQEDVHAARGQPRPSPRIVIAVDEFAHLMRWAPTEVEESVCRLAQMSRAAGIHLLLATDFPSPDVVTDLIKASVPARISLRQPTRRESRAILDARGAESLLARGDMLYLRPSAEGLIRLHGPRVSDGELARLAAFLCRQGRPAYDETITEEPRIAPARPRRPSGGDRG